MAAGPAGSGPGGEPAQGCWPRAAGQTAVGVGRGKDPGARSRGAQSLRRGRTNVSPADPAAQHHNHAVASSPGAAAAGPGASASPTPQPPAAAGRGLKTAGLRRLCRDGPAPGGIQILATCATNGTISRTARDRTSRSRWFAELPAPRTSPGRYQTESTDVAARASRPGSPTD
jgi:hypothetical protein